MAWFGDAGSWWGGGRHGDRAHPGHLADGLAVLGEAEEAGGVRAVLARVVVVAGETSVAVRDRQHAAPQRGVGGRDHGDRAVIGREHEQVAVDDAERRRGRRDATKHGLYGSRSAPAGRASSSCSCSDGRRGGTDGSSRARARARRARRATPARRRRRAARTGRRASAVGGPTMVGATSNSAPCGSGAHHVVRNLGARLRERLEQLVGRGPFAAGSHTRVPMLRRRPIREASSKKNSQSSMTSPGRSRIGRGVLCERLGEEVLVSTRVVGPFERHGGRDHVVRGRAVSVGNGSMVTSSSSAPSASTMRRWSGNADAGLPPQTTSAAHGRRRARGSPRGGWRRQLAHERAHAGAAAEAALPRTHRRHRLACRLRRPLSTPAPAYRVALAREATAHHVERLHQMLGDVRMRAHVGAGARSSPSRAPRARTRAPLRRSGRGRRR